MSRRSERRVEGLVRQQLDRRLEQIRGVASLVQPPRGGWVGTLRQALGMTQAQLARRMGISPQAVSQLEQREADGSVTLKALEQAAQALGARLTYAIVPDRPIEAILEQRARAVAARLTDSVRHTMRLEDQEPDASLGQRTEELAKELLSSPRQLWTEPGGP